MPHDPQRQLRLRAPGRLHLGFLDPAGTLGRRFGSLGLVIDGVATELQLGAASSDQLLAAVPEAEAEIERAGRYLQLLREHTGRDEPLRLQLDQVLPPHAGFGSGTQLALAIGRAFAHWHGLALSSTTLAHWLARGLRSGIGIAGFDHGGLLLDGGPGADGMPAPLLSRLNFPPDWRIVVVQDPCHRGLSGAQEKQAIASLVPLPRALAADICHQVLMRVLPGAASAEFAPFAAGINQVQQLLGRHFAPAQGGDAFTSAAVGRVVRSLADAARDLRGGDRQLEQGAAIGQSSWGPTGFAILPSQASAQAALAALRAAGLLDAGLTLSIVAGLNRGATLIEQGSS
jgi:beta-RFAP synthase